MSGILVFFHCASNTGYAIGRLESTFAEMARRLAGSYDAVHFGYPEFHGGPSRTLPKEITHFVRFDPASRDRPHLEGIGDYIARNDIRLAFGFDQPTARGSYAFLRRGGVEKLVSYWGAPMSSIYPPLLLPLRRLQYRTRRGGPDHYIFESEGMRRTATHGVGIPQHRTSVIRCGVDIDQFKPGAASPHYVHSAFNIEMDRKVVYYSGHMEERKGVHVIVRAAAHLVNDMGRRDLHFVFLGNKPGQELRFMDIYRGTEAEEFITFGGYRDDVAEIQASSYMAVIATTGWDSHTITAVEVAASGLPLVVSDLDGIREVISEETGYWFKTGDHLRLASIVAHLADDPTTRNAMGDAARRRAVAGYTQDHQVSGLESVVRVVAGGVLG